MLLFLAPPPLVRFAAVGPSPSSCDPRGVRQSCDGAAAVVAVDPRGVCGAQTAGATAAVVVVVRRPFLAADGNDVAPGASNCGARTEATSAAQSIAFFVAPPLATDGATQEGDALLWPHDSSVYASSTSSR